MPAIDTDLFQVLALALLLATLVTLLVAVSTLGAIKKQLESGTRTSAAEPVAQSSYDYTPSSTDYEPAYTAPIATEPSAAAEVSTGYVSVADALEPAAASTAAPASSAGLLGNEPEEQPFERDGRWWFKRGGELLVYDEGTGQWVAAPGAGAPAATTASQGTSTAVTTTTVAEAGEGWKCASCGAVNGSTATSCRMCFAPR